MYKLLSLAPLRLKEIGIMFYSRSAASLKSAQLPKSIYKKSRSSGSRHNSSRLQLGLCSFASDCALNEAVGVRLRSEDSGILAQVLDALVP